MFNYTTYLLLNRLRLPAFHVGNVEMIRPHPEIPIEILAIENCSSRPEPRNFAVIFLILWKALICISVAGVGLLIAIDVELFGHYVLRFIKQILITWRVTAVFNIVFESL